MTTLILIRHGESEANRHDIFAGWSDPELLEKGVNQARCTAKFIASNYKVDKIYSSDLKRAYKTARCLAEIIDAEILTNKNLREINGGAWELMNFKDIAGKYPNEFEMWLNNIGKASCVDGESVSDLGNRVSDALTEIAEENDGKTIAVATHATPIRAMQSYIQFKNFDGMGNIPWVSNASVTILEYENNNWKIVNAGLDEHLAEMKTSLPENV